MQRGHYREVLEKLGLEGFRTLRLDGIDHELADHLPKVASPGVEVFIMRLTDRVHLLSVNDLDDLVAEVIR